MNVQQLISCLQQFPPDAIVVVPENTDFETFLEVADAKEGYYAIEDAESGSGYFFTEKDEEDEPGIAVCLFDKHSANVY